MNDLSEHPGPAVQRLSEKNLFRLARDVVVPDYDRSKVRIGVVHFGPGAFHRGHQACYLDSMLASDPRWAICGVELKSERFATALEPQDCLYVVTQLGRDMRYRVVGALKECLTAMRQPDAIFARLVRPEVKLVTMTVTEKAYCLDGSGALDLAHPDIAHDIRRPAVPRSAVGWLAEGLARRKALRVPPFAAVSCDNMASNGEKLKKALLSFVRSSGQKDLAAWIEDEARFPCTMVDSITPAADDALRAKVTAATGLYDAAPVQREQYQQWVVEDILGPEQPDLASVGVNLTKDVGAFEKAKLRLLNGAHSTLAYIGLLSGYTSVLEAMGDVALSHFVIRLMREDVAPSLAPAVGLDLDAYIGVIVARFRNPALTHLLYQIASDGSQKLPHRILGTIKDAIQGGRPIARLVVPVAAWMRFVAREAKEGRALDDPLGRILAGIGGACTGRAIDDLPRFLELRNVFDSELASAAPFVAALGSAYDDLTRCLTAN
ncbi:MAG: mannitol dehydrogenase family protein [Alphaproteobacteria bacterium]|nr:mannitol dehydrogenase family protein [Alphaproteobacteria bacterium]